MSINKLHNLRQYLIFSPSHDRHIDCQTADHLSGC